MSWQVRPFEAGDEPNIVALWEAVFGKPMSVDTWRWKFFGRESVGTSVWVAVDAEQGIVGHYGGVPMDLKVGSAVVPVFNGVDAMTHPDFRRRGVSTAILRAAHDAWGAAGALAAIGLPNEKLRTWRSVAQPDFDLRWLRRPLRLDEVVRRPGRAPGVVRSVAAPAAALVARLGRRRWPRTDGRVELRAASEPGFDWPDLDAVWERVGPAYEVCVVRDASWWRWRFADCPTFRYEVVVAYAGGAPIGAAAYRLHDEGGARRGVLAELFTAPDEPDAADALMRASLEALWEERAGTVHALAPVGGQLAATLSRYGFQARPQGFEYMHVPLLEAGRELSRDPRAWHMSGAEFDVV